MATVLNKFNNYIIVQIQKNAAIQEGLLSKIENIFRIQLRPLNSGLQTSWPVHQDAMGPLTRHPYIPRAHGAPPDSARIMFISLALSRVSPLGMKFLIPEISEFSIKSLR